MIKKYFKWTYLLLIALFQVYSLCPNDDDYWDWDDEYYSSISNSGTLNHPFKSPKISLPLSTGIDSRRENYYAITGLTPGVSYTVSVYDMVQDVDLYVYDADHTFTNVVCSGTQAGITSESCPFTASGAAVFIKVTDATSTNDSFSNIYFNLQVE